MPVVTLDRQHALKASFPYNKDADLGVATSKAYPALIKEWRDGSWKHGVTVEVYDKSFGRVEFYDIPRAGPAPQLS
jgi:hypothetical protein